jgi:transketolase
MDINLIANTIRGLSMDAVQKANSGHPGMPMGVADFGALLFVKFLKHNPTNPHWADRDRYVQSAGHGSMFLYSILHLCGYDLPMEEIKNFRQWGSKTPGHPEYGLTPGVETTTGPLGQGCGNAVGMALAEAMLAEKFNRDGYPIVDHHTFVIAGDGDMMEGISHESFSLAGHLRLHKLIVFYDFNRITIEGSTDLAYSDNVRKRFEGYNWNVLEIDAYNHAEIEEALAAAKGHRGRPTLIIGHTHIGKGSPHKQDTAHAHGEPLGVDEVKLTKQALGIPLEPEFLVPDEVRKIFAARRPEWAARETAWNDLFAAYGRKYPELAAEFKRHLNRELPADLDNFIPKFDLAKPIATRAASGATLQLLAKAVPQLVGGSADLAGSNNTMLKDYASVGPGSYGGRNFHFGIREHAMGAVLSGLSLHGGWIVYGGTFMTFTDYFKPSIRLAAIMEVPAIYVLTHDSIFLGEDGPTHQAIEHLAALRSIPNVKVIRPADATETAVAWITALRRTKGPTALVLTRQALPVIDRSKYAPATLLNQGAYVLWQSGTGKPDLILIATGSEVSLALDAAAALAKDSTNVRVVSMPSWDLFEKQPPSVRDEVLPPSCTRRLAIEAGSSFGWDKYVGPKGRTLCIDHFGASAPAKVLAQKFGFTVDNVVKIVREM